ncbi:unnamed protein product [Caenorhabditis nigoni]
MENPSCSSWKRKNRCNQTYQTTSIILSQLFFLLLFSSFFSPTEQFGIFGPCTSATWSDWTAWSSCPVTSVIDPTVVARRTRTCTQSPWLCSGNLPCEGEAAETLVCGTTTTKERYSTIVFGTTAFDETTTVGDVTTTELTTTEATTAAATTTADITTTTAASETTKDSVTTTEASATTLASTTKGSDTETTTEGTATDATTAAGSATSATSGRDQETTLDFTFPSNAPGVDTTLPVEESTAPYDECAEPVTTVSTMAPGTMGTLFPGGGGGGDGGLDPFTFPPTPDTMPGVTRSPSCKTTPVLTTTIAFKTCTMIAVSTTTPMISSTTSAMDSTTTSSGISTTLDSLSTTSASETSTAPKTSTESDTSDAASTTSAAGSSTETNTTPGGSSESPTSDSQVSTTEGSVSSSESATSESASSPLAESTTESSSSSEGSSESPSATTSESASSESVTSDSPLSSSEPSASSEEPSSSSEEPNGSTEEPNASTQEPSASSEEPSGSSDSPSSEEPIVSTDAAGSTDETTPSIIDETTTEYTWTTCNDCSQINVQLFNGNPYEDASSVLNRYSVAGCYYLQFYCRPIEIGDTTPVSTILSGDLSYLSAPLAANLACRDKKWVLLDSTSALASSVSSLGCVYAIATTTKPKTTTFPGIDPNNPCMNCSNLVVSQSIYPEGVTYLDHTLNSCLSVEAHCLPINGGTEVELMYNNKGILDSGSAVNRTFTCTKNSKWLDVSTNNIINNISCIMPKTVTTTPIVASTLSEIPSTDGGSPTKNSSIKPVTEPKTTPDAEPPEEVTTPGAFISTTQLELTTIEDLPSTVPAAPPTPGSTQNEEEESTTTTLPATCNNCAALEPLSRLGPGKYNGMLVLWHYRQNGCNRVSISCQATMSESDVAYLYYNPNGEVMSGTGELAMDLICTNGNYVYQGKTISTVSCLASTSAVIPITTLPPITTPAPGDDCSGCNRLPVEILSATSGYTNGLLKATTSYSNCMSVYLTCYGVSSTDQAYLVYADSPLSNSKANTNLTLTCNTAGMWVTEALQTVESISCGYIPEVVTTTALPSSCGICANMESAEALLQSDYPDGMIVLYNYVDRVSKCKKVDISCQGTTSTQNSALIFNPIGTVSSGPGVNEISLNCSSDGKWKYMGAVVNTVSCIISGEIPGTPPTTTIVPSTTTNPAIPMCAQCSRLTAGAVSSIDDSLINGITAMTFSTENSCSTVQVVCSGVTSTERVTLLAATTSLISGVGSVSFNFKCNSAAEWMTSAGTIVDSVACGRYNLTTSTPATTTTTTRTTTTVPRTTVTTVTQCSKCANMLAKAVNPTDGSYDGMIILNHFTSTNGCRAVDVSCGPTLNTENATIIFGSTIVATGAATHSFSLTCDSNANWIYESTSVSTVSCLISTASNGVTVAPTTAGTTVKDDTAIACSQCGRAPIVSVGSGSTYLNGFTTVVQSTDSQGCSILSIKCQGMTTGDAVALLSSGLPYSSGFGTASANLTCNSQSQWVGRASSVISSLACGHKNAATTRSVVTTLAPSGLCTSCENMVAISMAGSQSNSYDGMVIMDHFISPFTGCRMVTVTCAPTVATENATLYFNSNTMATGMASHEFDLTCDATGVWTYDSTTINTVGCLISTGTGVATTVTTMAPVTNPSNNLCSQCPRLPIQTVSSTSGFQNGFTTLTTTLNTFGCSVVTMMCQGVTSDEPIAIVVNGNYAVYASGVANYTDFACNSQGQWTSTSFGIVSSVMCQRTVTTVATTVTTTTARTTTTTSNAMCNSCADFRPRAMGSGANYDGMVVINHYKDRGTSCRKATIDCMTTMDYETASLYLDNQQISSSGQVEVDMQCSSNGVWMYNGQQYSTTSCLVSNTTTSTGKKRKKRQAGTGLTACQSCSALPMTSLYAFYPYMNGFSTISIDDSSSCMTAVAACEGVTTSDSVAWIASGTILSSGTHMVNMTFTCNSLSTWQTSTGSVFSSLSCGRQYATTTVATTTVSSQALNCPNLIAAPLSAAELGANESNGQLILDHFIDTTVMAREVTITCYGSSSTDNATISFNGGSRTMSGTGQIELTMTCSSSGQWMRNGIAVQTVACIVVTPPGSTVPITTTIPTTPTTSAGSLPSTNCARNVMLTIPNGYNAGYLSMNTISTETSLQVVMSCAAPTGISESMLLSSTGAISTSGSPNTNMTMTCNSASQWVVSSTSGTGIPVGTIITSLACVVAVAPSTTLVPATVAAGCQLCPNLPAIGLLPAQLDANERNGQFILDHVTTATACRVVYLSCAGSTASENSTILFNGGSQTMSNQGITSTVLTCTSSSTWDWYGSSVGYASCKVADRALTTTTAPISLTTSAYIVPGDTGLACSRSDLVNPLIEGDAGAYLVLDTKIVNGGLSTTLSCAAPDNTATAVLTNGDGSVLGQSSNGLINMTLTCNSNSQWVISAISSSTTGTSAPVGTVVDDLKCGEVAAPTTTTTLAMTTTPSGQCQSCPNMQAIALTSSQLVVNGATNGQLLLSHSVDQSSKCRIVVIKCRGENTNQNATIFFNANGQSLSAQYGQVSTSMACSPSNVWQRNGVQIDGVACMITSVVGATSTSPAPITTIAPTSTTQSSNGPSASCNTGFFTAISAPGYTSGFMTVDTQTSGNVMTADVTCASPVSTQTAALLDQSNNQVSSGVGSTFMILTCNANSQWVTPTGTPVTTLSCGTIAPATTTTIATTLATVAATALLILSNSSATTLVDIPGSSKKIITGLNVTTFFDETTPTTVPAATDCSAAAWNTWQEWTACTDTCGSCGTQTRFRSCNKPLDTCTCTGTAYEKEYCNLAVCKFPKDSCCEGFVPKSSGGTFVCLVNTTATATP